jgi:8-oxo-dGTP diphosphatase
MASSSSPVSTRPVSVPREYPPAPLVGVAAAVFNARGQVLLVRRGRPPGQGQWGLPGGLLDVGERLADGARREIREECAVEVVLGDIVGTFEPIERDEAGEVRYHYVVVDFWAHYAGGEPTAGDDAIGVDWFHVQELECLPMRADTRSLIRKAHQAWRQS